MKFLICSDGSPAAEQATQLGAVIAVACGAEVTLFGVIEDPAQAAQIQAALEQNRQLLDRQNVRAVLVTVSGDPVSEIVKHTQEIHFDLVVIGSVRKAGISPFWISSKTYRIIKRIHPPVLAVMNPAPAVKRILICTGGRSDIDNAVSLTSLIARGLGASVTLFHVMPEAPALYSRFYLEEDDVATLLNSRSQLGRSLKAQKQTLESLGVATEVRLRQGAVLHEILDEIRQGGYDLVVTGSSLNEDRFRTYFLGDITREIVNHSGRPILVVRRADSGRGTPRRLKNLFKRLTHPASSLKPGGKK